LGLLHIKHSAKVLVLRSWENLRVPNCINSTAPETLRPGSEVETNPREVLPESFFGYMRLKIKINLAHCISK